MGQDLVLASRETRTVQKKRLAIPKSQENNLSSLWFGPKVAIRSKSMSVNKRGVDTLIADEGRTHFMVPALLSQSRILPRDSRPTRGTKPWLSVVVSHLSCYRETWVHLIIILYLVIRRYVAKGNKVILFKNLLAWLSILFFLCFFYFIFLLSLLNVWGPTFVLLPLSMNTGQTCPLYTLVAELELQLREWIPFATILCKQPP